MYNEVDGDIIQLTKQGKFDVIAHGCNCFCSMGAGLAPQMAKAFACDRYPKESKDYQGSINKLGTIDCASTYVKNGESKSYLVNKTNSGLEIDGWKKVLVVNAYTQFGPGFSHRKDATHPLSYPALILCFQKMNHAFKGKHIGLPQIGAGLAGGNWEDIKKLINTYFTDCDVTVVNYKPKEDGSNSN